MCFRAGISGFNIMGSNVLDLLARIDSLDRFCPSHEQKELCDRAEKTLQG